MTDLITEDELKMLQKSAFFILKTFDDFCTTHKLKYSLAFGTLLGAIRSKGFIPWDDDIDVYMLRNDYERFLSLTDRNLSTDVLVQNYQTEPEFIHAFTRLVLDKTIAEQDAWKELDFHKGIFIDVFPLDKLAPQNQREKHEFRINRLRRLKIDKLKYRYDKEKTDWKDSVKRILLMPFSLKFLNQLLNKEVQRFNDTNTFEVSSLTEGVIGYYEDFKLDSRSFDSIIYKEFEGRQFPVTSNYDEILERHYPNYMTRPPKSDREPHHGFIRLKFRDDIIHESDK